LDQDQEPEASGDASGVLICSACGKRGGDVRPDFNWNKTPVKAMGYR
jgi:hypothetical protein